MWKLVPCLLFILCCKHATSISMVGRPVHMRSEKQTTGKYPQSLFDGSVLGLTIDDCLQGRIIGGHETEEHEYPWAVYLEMESRTCGGVILTSRHVMTAAHCTHGKNLDYSVIKAGVHDSRADSGDHLQLIGIERILIHPGYDGNTTVNDISVIVTDEPIKFTEAVGRVCLPYKQVGNEVVGEHLIVVGWGRRRPDKPNDKLADNPLYHVSLQIVPPIKCVNEWPQFQLDGSQICLFGGYLDTCNGDSGGPMVRQDPLENLYYLIALVSYGSTECGVPVPSVGVNISAYLGWILQIISTYYPEAVLCK